ALAAGFARLLGCPLVRGALLVRRLAAFARDLSLLAPVHRRKPTILFSHATSSALPFVLRKHTGCNRCATESRKPRPYNKLGKDLPYCHARPSCRWENKLRSAASPRESAV